jgi:hypothetical protein
LPESYIAPKTLGVGSENGGMKLIRRTSAGSLPTRRASASITRSIA